MPKVAAHAVVRGDPPQVFIAEDLSISLNTAYKSSSRGGPWLPHSIRLANGAKRVRRDWYEEWLARMEIGDERCPPAHCITT
ncbi:MAG: hypothetical protein ACRD0E_03900 [Acidimicrobiales bacterium]